MKLTTLFASLVMAQPTLNTFKLYVWPATRERRIGITEKSPNPVFEMDAAKRAAPLDTNVGQQEA